MTSRNSFWVSSKENHKRRIWVWIVTVLAQLMIYVGILTVYISRIRMWNSEGSYRTYEQYKDALYQATKDALGFQDNLPVVLIGLAVIIGAQGFSYLYDRRKVDMYHSVPVNKNKRFAVVYVNGIFMYLVSALVSIFIGVVAAAVQGAVNGEVMAVIGLGYIWNLLFFLVMYHTVILAVMITGNWFITLCVAGGLMIYEMTLYELVSNMRYSFFKTVSGFYVTPAPKLSAIYDYYEKIWELKQAASVRELAKVLLPYYGKWFILSVVILAAAWWCYSKRPSEAAGKALAFPKIGAALKVVVVIPIGLSLGMWVHRTAYSSNTVLTVASMIAFGVIGCAAMEVIYDFDIKSLFRHFVSSGIAVVGIVVVFLIFKQDLSGYDEYVPLEDKLDSIALSVDYYGSFWDSNFNYLNNAEFSEAHMYLQDVEPVLTLAAKAQQEDPEDMDDPRCVNVLYRLKSGRRVGRCFYVDFSNPVNEELMNRIVGTQEFREGTYQIMTDRDSYDMVSSVTYSNGAANVALPVADVHELREAYIKDMEKIDFTLLSTERPCGQINFQFPNWLNDRIDVYDCFDNTIAYLQSREAYYPITLNPEDIADITVTNYHKELIEINDSEGVSLTRDVYNAERVWADTAVYDEDYAVSETFFAQEELGQIVDKIYPGYMSSAWNDSRELDENFDIFITFKRDTTYPYDRSNIGVYYKFFKGQAPEFVTEATAYHAEEE